MAVATTDVAVEFNSKSSKSGQTHLHTFQVMKSHEQFTVDKCYTYLKTLGVGAYGVVISARDSRTNTGVAIKKIPNAWSNFEDGLRVLREMATLQHFSHFNIVRMIDIIPPEPGKKLDDVYLVMELMDTDLRKVISSSQPLSVDHVQYFIYQILKALKHVHSAGIVHRDIKPGNLLVNGDCTLRLCDFGLARCVDATAMSAEKKMTEYVVTRHYRAPELLCNAHTYDYKVDVWSAGCILGELFTRTPLFPGKNVMQQLQLILSALGTPKEEDLAMIECMPARQFVSTYSSPGKPWAELIPGAPPQAIDLIQKMLQFNPAKRISIAECLEHPFVAGFHDPNTEPDCTRKFDSQFYRLSFNTKQMLQDFAWEEIYKFHPHLRPAGPKKTDKYFAAAATGPKAFSKVKKSSNQEAKKEAVQPGVAAVKDKEKAMSSKDKASHGTGTTAGECQDAEMAIASSLGSEHLPCAMAVDGHTPKTVAAPAAFGGAFNGADPVMQKASAFSTSAGSGPVTSNPLMPVDSTTASVFSPSPISPHFAVSPPSGIDLNVPVSH